MALRLPIRVASTVKSQESGRLAGFLFRGQPERSIVVVMAVLLNDHDLGIVIAPPIVMAARPPTMKTTIVMSVFRNNYRSIVRVCGYGWQRNCDHA
jgi:hypothetical protein